MKKEVAVARVAGVEEVVGKGEKANRAATQVERQEADPDNRKGIARLNSCAKPRQGLRNASS